jgi:hypothetical protein
MRTTGTVGFEASRRQTVSAQILIMGAFLTSESLRKKTTSPSSNLGVIVILGVYLGANTTINSSRVAARADSRREWCLVHVSFTFWQ